MVRRDDWQKPEFRQIDEGRSEERRLASVG